MSARDELAQEASLMTAGPSSTPPPCPHPVDYRTTITPWQTRWNGVKPVTQFEWACRLCGEEWKTTLADGSPPYPNCKHPKERWIQTTPWERDLHTFGLVLSGWRCGLCDARWIERLAW